MRVYPVMLAATPLALWAVSVASGSGLVDSAGNVVGADFAAFYTAGSFVRAGRTDALGCLVAQSDFQHRLVAPVVVEGFTPWISPPFVAYLFAPLAGLPYPVALGCFWSLGILTLVVTLVLSRRLLGLAQPTGRLLLLALSYFPTAAWLTFGQTSVFSLALMTASVAGLLSGREVLAGLALGCFACKPQLALGLGAALLFARRWRAVLGAVASAVGLFGASALSLPGPTRAWLVGSPALFSFIRQSGYPMGGLASLYGASALLLDGVSRTVAGVVGAALTLAAVAGLHALWRRVPWRPSRPSFRFALAATLAVALLVSPHLYFYDLMLLLLPAALAFEALSRRPSLDASPILAATSWVYYLGLPSPYLALAQQAVSRRLTGHPAALQLETLAVGLWAWRVGRRAVAEVALEG